MNYGLLSIGLTDDALGYASAVDNLEVIFDQMSIKSELIVHVDTNGNMSHKVCPETRGVFRMSKLDNVIAGLQFTGRASGEFYSGTFAKSPKNFFGWKKAMTPAEEDLDDLPLETTVQNILTTIGDISLVEHYGADIVSILNKYTRQVLTDSSSNPNKIRLENYYGNIQDISYDTPILVQVINSSINGVPGEITFIKDIYEDLVFIETITATFPLFMTDLSGFWNDTRAISQGDLTENVFYNVLKRQYESSPGVMSDCFVILSPSGQAEIVGVSNRVSTLEGYLSNTVTPKDTYSIYKILATQGTITDLSSTSITTEGLSTGTLSVAGAISLIGVPKISIPNGVEAGSSTISALVIGTSLNLTTCSVSLKSSPSNNDLIDKSYVDTKVSNVTSAKFVASTNPPPAEGTPGTFYFQLS